MKIDTRNDHILKHTSQIRQTEMNVHFVKIKLNLVLLARNMLTNAKECCQTLMDVHTNKKPDIAHFQSVICYLKFFICLDETVLLS